jgi:hypothetical protein
LWGGEEGLGCLSDPPVAGHADDPGDDDEDRTGGGAVHRLLQVVIGEQVGCVAVGSDERGGGADDTNRGGAHQQPPGGRCGSHLAELGSQEGAHGVLTSVVDVVEGWPSVPASSK